MYHQMVRITSFVLGCMVGIYMDQTHKMPNMEKWVKQCIYQLKQWEEKSRK
jgi:hypothetical protein